MLQTTQKAAVLALATLAAPLLIGGCGDTGGGDTGGTNVGTTGTATKAAAAAAGVAGVNSMGSGCDEWVDEGCAQCASDNANSCVLPASGYLLATNGAVYEDVYGNNPTGFPYYTSSGKLCAANEAPNDCDDAGQACLVPYCAECNSDGSACNQCEADYAKGLAPGPDGIGMYQYCLPENASDCPTNQSWDSVGHLEHNLCAEVECLIPGCDKCSIANQCDVCANGTAKVEEGPDGKMYRFCVDESVAGGAAGVSGMRGDCIYDAWDSATVIPHLHTPYHNHNPLC